MNFKFGVRIMKLHNIELVEMHREGTKQQKARDFQK
jgi:hypothetical protein